MNVLIEVIPVIIVMIPFVLLGFLFYGLKRFVFRTILSNVKMISATIMTSEPMGNITMNSKTFRKLRVYSRELAVLVDPGDRVLVYYRDQYTYKVFSQHNKTFQRPVPFKIVAPNGVNVRL